MSSEILDGIEYRPIRPHELMAWERAISRGFGESFSPRPGTLERVPTRMDFSRSMAALDGKDVVGTMAALAYQLPLPAGSIIDMSGIVAVTVQPTHRRRGIFTEMMRRLLRNEYERGITVAGLWASQSIIYGRHGYGNAVEHQEATIEKRFSQFRHTASVNGQIRFSDPETIRRIGPSIWEAAMKNRPGMIPRPTPEWEMEFPDASAQVPGDKLSFFITYEESGVAEGYSAYRIKPIPNDSDHNRQIEVNEIVATSVSVEAALWRHVLDVDLVKQVVNWNHPKRSPLLWLLQDPRHLKLEPYDALWLRIMDPAKALTAREYGSAGQVTIAVQDSFCPWAEGTYLLEVDDEGSARCESTNGLPDVTMPIATLASIYLGAHHLQHLQSAGRVDEHSPGSVAKLDTMFPTTDMQSVVHVY